MTAKSGCSLYPKLRRKCGKTFCFWKTSLSRWNGHVHCTVRKLGSPSTQSAFPSSSAPLTGEQGHFLLSVCCWRFLRTLQDSYGYLLVLMTCGYDNTATQQALLWAELPQAFIESWPFLLTLCREFLRPPRDLPVTTRSWFPLSHWFTKHLAFAYILNHKTMLGSWQKPQGKNNSLHCPELPDLAVWTIGLEMFAVVNFSSLSWLSFSLSSF